MRVDAERILIVLLGAIGDVVRALPLALRLRAAYPRAHIAWAIEPASADLLRRHPAIDRIILFERGRGLGAFVEFLRAVRRGNFDLVLDLQRHAKSAIVSRATGARVRVGFSYHNSREFNWLFNTHAIAATDHFASKLEQYQLFGDFLELPRVPIEFGIRLSDSEQSRVRGLLTEVREPFAGIFVGSTWPSRMWPASRWVAVAGGLRERGLGVVLIGGQGESKLAAEIAQQVEVLNLTGKTSLREAFGVFARARVAIGPDCGPMHLAAAAKARVVSLWGPTSPARSAPWDSEDLVVVGRVACAPCYLRRCPVGNLCMEAIDPQRVLRVVDRAIEEAGCAR